MHTARIALQLALFALTEIGRADGVAAARSYHSARFGGNALSYLD